VGTSWDADRRRPSNARGTSAAGIVLVSVVAAVLASAATTFVLERGSAGPQPPGGTSGGSAVPSAAASPVDGAAASRTPAQSDADVQAVVARTAQSVALVDRGDAFGSGFVVSAGGWLVTNHHVVADQKTVAVTFPDGREMEGIVRAIDSLTDLALVKVAAADVPPLQLGPSADLQVGQRVIAIGNPLGLENTVTSGIVSAVGRSGFTAIEDQGQYRNLIQTDAAINGGNSGGPLVDLAGRVVGVNTLGENGADNLAFAIPSDVLAPLVEAAVAGRPTTRPYLGVRYLQVNAGLEERADLHVDHGVYLTKRPDSSGVVQPAITPGSPAARAGLREGDVIVAIDDAPIDAAHPLENVLVTHAAGEAVTLTIERDGELGTVTVTLGARAPATP